MGLGEIVVSTVCSNQQEVLPIKLTNLINLFSRSQYNELLQ